MKIDIRKYPEDNLIIVDVKSDRNKLLNMVLIGFSDDKKDISLKRTIFDTNEVFTLYKDYNVLDICEEIVNAYGDKGDLEKLWLAHMIYDEIYYNE